MSELRVLMIDDNPGDINLLREAFAEAGIAADFLVAENAVQAYTLMRDLLESRAPDLILIDINLPIIKGPAILRELSDFRPWRKARRVMLSSSAAPLEIAECLKLGAAEYVVKPSVFEDYIELARRLRRMCAPIVSARQVAGSAAASLTTSRRHERRSDTSAPQVHGKPPKSQTD